MTGDRRIILESVANVPSDIELLLDAINDGIHKFLPKVLENLIQHIYIANDKKPPGFSQENPEQKKYGGLLDRNKNRIYHNIWKEKDGI